MSDAGTPLAPIAGEIWPGMVRHAPKAAKGPAATPVLSGAVHLVTGVQPRPLPETIFGVAPNIVGWATDDMSRVPEFQRLARAMRLEAWQ